MRKDVLVLGGTAVVLVAAALVGATVYRSSQQKAAPPAAAAGSPAGRSAQLLVRPHSRAQGPADAKVTVVEFLDPECESCRQMYPLVKQVMAEYQGRARLVVRYMPFHRNSLFAASALEAAGDQGKYWEMLEALFANQPLWGDHHHPRPELIPEIAKQVGLDMEAFNKALSNPESKREVEQDQADGKALGVTGTPTFFVNGRLLDQLGYEPLKALIEEELRK